MVDALSGGPLGLERWNNRLRAKAIERKVMKNDTLCFICVVIALVLGAYSATVCTLNALDMDDLACAQAVIAAQGLDRAETIQSLADNQVQAVQASTDLAKAVTQLTALSQDKATVIAVLKATDVTTLNMVKRLEATQQEMSRVVWALAQIEEERQAARERARVQLQEYHNNG